MNYRHNSLIVVCIIILIRKPLKTVSGFCHSNERPRIIKIPQNGNNISFRTNAYISTSSLYSTSRRWKVIKPSDNDINKSINDILLVLFHLLCCVCFSVSVCWYENFDCSHLKPNSGTIRSSATRGMGFGLSDRIALSKSFPSTSVLSYNEVMLKHRFETVPRWKKLELGYEGSEGEIKNSVENLYKGIFSVLKLKSMAKEYQWNEMKILLDSSLLRDDIERSCSLIRSTLLDQDSRMEIGFDWGSCAWRHCGALADAQEAISFLSNSIGLLEPSECLFCLDIIERSLRDVVAVVPFKYYPLQFEKLPKYVKYIPKDEIKVDDDDSSIGTDFFATLHYLRNNLDTE